MAGVAPSTTIPLGLPAVASGNAGAAGQTPPPAPTPQALGQPVPPGTARIVRNGSLQINIGKGRLQSAFDQAGALATGTGGFVADSSMSTADGTIPSATLTLRVPADRLSSVINALSQIGTIHQQDLKGDDVTGQLVDLAARIQNLRAEEDALRTILSRAQAIGDILQVQGQLFEVRQQVEQLTAQQTQLDNKATYATLVVQLSETGPAVAAGTRHPSPAKPSTWTRAARLARDNTLALFHAVTLTAGWLAPVLVLGLLVLPVYLWYRRRAAAMKESPTTD
jgi:hypothetical protein